MEAYLEESNEMRDFLIVRGFLEKILNSQFKLDWNKSLVDGELTIETILEKALHLKAVTIIEKDKEPKVAVLQPGNTEKLIISVINIVEFLSLSRDSRGDNRNSFREKNNFRRSSSRVSNQSRRFGSRGRVNRGRTCYKGGRY